MCVYVRTTAVKKVYIGQALIVVEQQTINASHAVTT